VLLRYCAPSGLGVPLATLLRSLCATDSAGSAPAGGPQYGVPERHRLAVMINSRTA
jgi:hypothetical protein